MTANPQPVTASKPIRHTNHIAAPASTLASKPGEPDAGAQAGFPNLRERTRTPHPARPDWPLDLVVAENHIAKPTTPNGAILETSSPHGEYRIMPNRGKRLASRQQAIRNERKRNKANRSAPQAAAPHPARQPVTSAARDIPIAEMQPPHPAPSPAPSPARRRQSTAHLAAHYAPAELRRIGLTAAVTSALLAIATVILHTGG